ncbi:hypothetical protein ACFOWB_04445 [Chenggangzhangella methanolivorans]|uniref:hypothetical protein n=1 Tax=Chenggangzhangella methanolivorans TaxID=1437009 RepID=UPI0036072DED
MADPVKDPAAWQREATERAKQAGKEPGLRDGSFGINPEAPIVGALQAVFQTRDFLFGATPKAEQSSLRRGVDDWTEHAPGLEKAAASLSQFGVGMLGAGKLAATGKVLPWFGKLNVAGKGAKVAAETAKAAAVGAVAFDPYEDRLSNMVQGTALANPVTGFLAADPSDSRAVGRMKAALESIGLDAALIGTFVGGVQVWKHLKAGDTEAAAKWTARLDKEQQGPEAVDLTQDAPRSPEAAETIAADVQPQHMTGGPEAAPTVSAPEGREVQVSGEQVDAATPQVTPPQRDILDVRTKTPEGSAVDGVDTPEQGVAQAGVGLPAPAYKAPSLDGFNAERLLTKLKADTDAIETAGSFTDAVAAGHNFAKGEQLPMQWLSEGSPERDLFVRRSVEAVNARIQKQRGGKGVNANDWAVQTDGELLRTVGQFARAYNESPDAILGALQQAARTAVGLPAQLEVGIMLTNKLKLEADRMASRIQLGDLTPWGGDRAKALGEFNLLVGAYRQTLGDTLAIRAAGGRVTRRGGGYLDRPDATLNDLSGGELLLDLWTKASHDPATLRKVISPTVRERAQDYAKYVLVNNLVSGPKTQIINILSNGGMMLLRPAEKIIGATSQRAFAAATGNAELAGSANRQYRQALRAYGFYATNLADAWSMASKAFLKNDSILNPHRTEAFLQNVRAGGNVQWKPADDITGVLHNAMYAAHLAIGLPTRGLGFVDELVKQTVYRSSLASRAVVRAMDDGMARGLSGDALREFVRQDIDSTLKAGFDEFGQGLDPEALREAQIATFSQDLQPGTLGKHVQALAQNNWAVGMLLPFVKTPTNALRYGWKLSPGLNMLQTEFRQAITGKAGPELQAEAIGQFSLGTMAMGVAALAAIDGRITGGGPNDPKMKAELMATGWQPYSFVRHNANGSRTYVPFGRLDPVAIPLGIAADIVDALYVRQQTGQDIDVEAAIFSPVLAITKQFREKSYLLSMSQALDALFDDDPKGERAQRFFGSMAANMVPYSAMMRQANPDDTLHEARGVVDRIMATVPGWSTKVPKRYDAWGDPVTAYSRNWFASDDDGSVVDREVQRLLVETGSSITRVAPRPRAGVDLRDITMKDGRNAYEVYAQLGGRPSPRSKPLKEVAAKLIASRGYKRAPDGDASTKGTKLYLLVRLVADYRGSALDILMKDPNVRDAILKKQRDVAAAYRGGSAKPQASESSGVMGLVNGVLGGGGSD